MKVPITRTDAPSAKIPAHPDRRLRTPAHQLPNPVRVGSYQQCSPNLRGPEVGDRRTMTRFAWVPVDTEDGPVWFGEYTVRQTYLTYGDSKRWVDGTKRKVKQ